MGRFFAFGCLGIIGLFIIVSVIGWTAFVQPMISKFVPGLFDIAYTTETTPVHVPLLSAATGETIALVNIPAAYVPSATHREGKTPTTILPIELSFPDLGPATQAVAGNPADVTLKESHVTAIYMTIACDPNMFSIPRDALAGAQSRSGYYQVNPAVIGQTEKNTQAFLYLDRQQDNSIITTCDRRKCTAMMYLGGSVCASVGAPVNQFDNVLKVAFLFPLRAKMRDFLAVRRMPLSQGIPALAQ